MLKIKKLCENYAPQLASLVGDSRKFWKKLDNNLETKFDSTTVGNAVENSISFLLIRAESGDTKAIKFLNTIENTIIELMDLVSEDLQADVRSTAEKLMKEIDPKPVANGPVAQYLNWYGELLSIHHILGTGAYELIRFDSPKENGGDVDFELRSKSNGQVSYVEVVNIHVNTDKALIPDALQVYLNFKLNEKYERKTKELEDSRGIYILPVLWFDDAVQKNILDFIEKNNLASRMIIEPCMLAYRPEIKEYRFGTVRSLLV